MPAHTGAFLTAEERRAFGAWLAACVKRSGVSKTALARETLGADSTQRLNRYLGGLVPTLPVLKGIVTRLRILPMLALWHAGYFRELLGAVDDLVNGPGTDADLRLLAILFAVRSFPRRDCVPTSIFGTEETMLEAMAVSLPGFEREWVRLIDFDRLRHKRLHPLLAHAAAALAWHDADPQTRRLVAAELVNAWSDQVDFEAATLVRSGFKTSLSEGGLLELKSTVNGKSVSRFFGDSRAAWAPFMPPVRHFITGFNVSPKTVAKKVRATKEGMP